MEHNKGNQNKGNQNRAGQTPGRDENTSDMTDQNSSKSRGDLGNQDQNQRQGAGQGIGNQSGAQRSGQDFNKNKGGQGGQR
jgi:hypothetical protein